MEKVERVVLNRHAQSSISYALAASEDSSSARTISQLSPTASTRTIVAALPALRGDLPLIGNFSRTHRANNSEVPRRISIEEYDVMIELMRVVDDVFRRHDVSYAMIGGTLLGSYYHHDMVPWDDDVDLVVDVANMDRTMQLLRSGSANYSAAKTNWPIVKFYRTDGRQVSSNSWTWPLIDIFFYRMNNTHWWVSESTVKPLDLIFPLDVVFPFHLRPFGPLWVPSPNDAKEYINIEQRLKNRDRKCASNKFNHANEQPLKWVTIPCEGLMNTYPFVVQRKPVAHSRQFIEVVRVGNETVQELVVPLPS